MPSNSESASTYLESSRMSRGQVVTHAGAPVSLGSGFVTSVRPESNGTIILVCQPLMRGPVINGAVEVTLIAPQAVNRGGTFSCPEVGNHVIWLAAGGANVYLGIAWDEASGAPFSASNL